MASPTPWYLRSEVLDLIEVIAASGLSTTSYTEFGRDYESFADAPLYSSLVAWHDVAAQSRDLTDPSIRVRPESVAAAVTGMRLAGIHFDSADAQMIPLRNVINAALEARCMAEAA